MKKILFTAIHPAPYIDQWIFELRKNYEIQVAYNYAKSAAKTWTTYTPVKGKLLKEYGLIGWFKQIITNDIIILNGWNKPYNIYSLIITLLFRKKVFVFSDYPVENSKYTFKWYIKKCFLSLLVPYILCATKSTQKYYQRIFSYKEKNTIFFPYATIKAPDLTEINRQRQSELLLNHKIRFFIANNFRKRKGYDIFIQSLLFLTPKELAQMDLIIAGSGELFHEYSTKLKGIKSDIKFLGWIEENEYENYLQQTDVLIHASTFEPFGIPPIDAMKFGKLVISSDGVKSINETIVDGINGYIFKAGNPQELSQKIKETIKNRDILYDIALKGKEDICKIYDNAYFGNLIL